MPQSSAQQSQKYSLLAPGPVNLHPKVREILSLPMIHHRTPEFDQILSKVFSGLKYIFQTKQRVFMHTSTGSGGMESLMVNTLSKGDEIIVINSGKFGERWVEMGKAFDLKVHEIKTPWGECVDPEVVETLLKTTPQIKAVFTQATETSTAVAHPIQKLGEIIHQYENCLFLVDGITAAGAYPLPFDEWKIDGLIAGSQKAFMLPTGLSFVTFSEKAWKQIEKSNLPKFYFNIKEENKANNKGETWFSSSVPLIRALEFVISDIEKIGLEKHFSIIHRRAQFTREFFPKLGLSLYSKSPSDSVTALLVPTGIDSQKIREHLEKTYNITIMGGQDQVKGKILRIGHMGYIDDIEMLSLLHCTGKSLQFFDQNLISNEQLQIILAQAQNWLESHSA